MTPTDVVGDAPSPVHLAARLNHFTPRDSAPVAAAAGEAAAPPAAPPVGEEGTVTTAEPRAAAVEPAALPFREAVRRREGTAELLLFRVRGELFAFALNHVEEAVELDTIHPIPEAVGATLGVVELRGRMVPVISPAPALGVAPGALAAMLVLRDGPRRVGVAVDDVDDVLSADLATLGPTPERDVGDGVLLAMARRGSDLVSVLDADALLAACLAESRTPETAA